MIVDAGLQVSRLVGIHDDETGHVGDFWSACGFGELRYVGVGDVGVCGVAFWFW